MPGTPGGLTITGSVDFADHIFPIAETATVGPLFPALAAAGEWSCVDLVADGTGVITDLALVASATLCGTIETTGAGIGQRHEFTTLVLDGDAGTLAGADADLTGLLDALAALAGVASPACLEFAFAADGTLASIALGYAESPGSDLTAPIACGDVDGTPAEYRDSASTPTPWDLTNIVSVDGFGIDVLLFDLPSVFVLLVSLDAGKEVCLLARVVDTVIVEVAVLTGSDPDVCGVLEVRGHQVNVDAVWVPTPLTALWSANVTNAVLGEACLIVRSQEGAAHGSVVMCETLTAVDDTSRPPGDSLQATFTASGVTFALTAPIEADPELVIGTPSGLVLNGPDPFEPFGPANPAQLLGSSIPGCAGIPDTAIGATDANAQPPAGLLGVLLATVAGFVALHRQRTGSRP